MPFGFFGVTMIGELTSPEQLPDTKLDEQMALMASSGVESTRVTLSTGGLEPLGRLHLGVARRASWRPRLGTTSLCS